MTTFCWAYLILYFRFCYLTGDSQFSVFEFEFQEWHASMNLYLMNYELNAFDRVTTKFYLLLNAMHEMREHVSCLFIVFLRQSSFLTHQCLEIGVCVCVCTYHLTACYGIICKISDFIIMKFLHLIFDWCALN